MSERDWDMSMRDALEALTAARREMDAHLSLNSKLIAEAEQQHARIAELEAERDRLRGLEAEEREANRILGLRTTELEAALRELASWDTQSNGPAYGYTVYDIARNILNEGKEG